MRCEFAVLLAAHFFILWSCPGKRVLKGDKRGVRYLDYRSRTTDRQFDQLYPVMTIERRSLVP